MRPSKCPPNCIVGKILLLILYFCETNSAGADSTCPENCLCSPITIEGGAVQTGYMTDCRGRGLTSFPTSVSTDTTELDLGQNYLSVITTELVDLVNLEILRLDGTYIQSLSPGVFRSQTNLKKLYLQNILLDSLDAHVFQGLGSLQILHLYNVGLRRIESGVFDELLNIQTIELSYNKLVILPDRLFKNLRNLQILAISHNELVSIGSEVFCGLSSLYYLSLRHNHLTSLQKRSMCSLPLINSLILLDNPISCDCDIKWLYEFLVDNSISGPVCTSPPQLSGSNLLDITFRDFCDLPRVNVFMDTTSTVLVKGTSVLLSCNATSHPVPVVSWTKDNNWLEPNGIDIVVSGHTLLVSSLRLTDSGVYLCIASSPAGAVTDSITITVVDTTYESLISLPIYSSSANIKIPCATLTSIIGLPVKWYFRSKPIGNDSVRHTVLGNGELYIIASTLVDNGEYTCVVGDIAIKRHLTIEEPSRITEFPSVGRGTVLVLDSSSPARLKCTATGNPVPVIQWFHNSVPILEEGEGLQEGFEVTMVHNIATPSLSDEGIYTCLAQNSLGEAIQEVTIRFRVNDTVNVISVEGMVGSVVSLHCGSSSCSMMSTWERKGGGELPSTSVTAVDGSLFIGSPVPSDSGVYVCTTDTGGSVWYNVTILAFPELTGSCAPSVISVSENDSIQLTCNTDAEAAGITVKWFLNEQELTSVLDHTAYKIQDDSVLLLIRVSQQHQGTYTCEASNALGNATRTFIVEVIRSPYFLSTPINLVINQNETAVFPCAGSGNPTPNVTWWRFVEDTPVPVITDNDDMVFVSQEYLTIVTASGTHSGKYYCALSSSAGTVRSHDVFLNVWTPPILADGLPTEYTIAEGEAVSLKCHARADPIPAVRWFRNGTRLPIAGQHTQDRYGLTILDPTHSDQGKYICRVINVAGLVDLKVFLTVIRHPSVTVTPTQVTSFIGCMTLITCLDHNQLPSNFTWTRNGISLGNTSRISIRDNGELLMTGLQLEDSGIYSCTVVTGMSGTNSANTSLRVIDGYQSASGEEPVIEVPRPPSIVTLTPRVQNINPGSDLQLVCISNGVLLTWSVNDTVLMETESVHIDNGLLLIRNVSNAHSGSYKCVATNDFGSVTESFVVSVNIPPEVTIPHQLITVTTGETVFVDCIASGYPLPSVTWLYSNGSSRIRVLENNTLVIVNASIYDTGLYTCVGSSMAGTSKTTVTITITEHGPILALRFLEPPLNQSILARSPVTLQCVATADHTPWILWSHRGVPITSNIPADNGSLVIEEAHLEHSGTYTCHATNGLTIIHTDVELIVEKRKEPPYFITKPMDTDLLEGEQLLLHCVTDGPDVIRQTWLINESIVSHENVGVVISEDGQILLVSSVSKLDSGSYTCQSENEYGRSQWTARVMVNTYPSNNSVTHLVGSTAQFICNDGAGNGNIQWNKDGVLIDNSKSIRVFVLLNNLWIFRMTVEETGEYTCSMEGNTIPLDVLHLKIDVPAFINTTTITSPVLIQPDTDAVLHCTGQGVPTPYITWSMGGVLLSIDNKYSLFPNGSLVIHNTMTSNAGQYVCIAENSAGQSEFVFNVLFG